MAWSSMMQTLIVSISVARMSRWGFETEVWFAALVIWNGLYPLTRRSARALSNFAVTDYLL
jgi:hypothetical protein